VCVRMQNVRRFRYYINPLEYAPPLSIVLHVPQFFVSHMTVTPFGRLSAFSAFRPKHTRNVNQQLQHPHSRFNYLPYYLG